MPRFFTESINQSVGTIHGDDAKHITRVLRMKIGDTLTACDTHGMDYQCVITALDERQVALSVQESVPSRGEPSVIVRLYQANPKADKFELIVQKAVELGVDEIIPVQTHRCVSRPDQRAMEKKLERYNRISQEAAKQCGRGKRPLVRGMLEFAQAVEEVAAAPCGILFYEKATHSLKEALGQSAREISILIGAEGGFEEAEVMVAREKGIQILSLGNRILRCETAPLAALAVIMFATENLG